MLSELPNEILVKISSYLDRDSFCNLRLVNRRLRKDIVKIPNSTKLIYNKKSILVFMGYDTLMVKKFQGIKSF